MKYICEKSLLRYTVALCLVAIALRSAPRVAAQHNVVFVTSTTYPSTLGSATAYDVQCNTRATAAGLNGPGNNEFVAWISDAANGDAGLRLAVTFPRGFVRTDGAPIADTVNDLYFNSSGILNPIDRDEFGSQVASAPVWTGTLADGSRADTAGVANTCDQWTSNTGFTAVGLTKGGPEFWTTSNLANCGGSKRIYCFQRTRNQALNVDSGSGRLAFLTAGTFTPTGGLAAADSLCSTEAATAGLSGTWKALLATSTASAASRFDGTVNYRRVDGILIGSGATVMAGAELSSGIWQSASGIYQTGPMNAFTGATSPAVPGTVATTCNDWTSTSGTLTIGRPNFSSSNWWDQSTGGSCSTPQHLYCLQDSEAGLRRTRQLISD